MSGGPLYNTLAKHCQAFGKCVMWGRGGGCRSYRDYHTRKCSVPRIPGKVIILPDGIIIYYGLLYYVMCGGGGGGGGMGDGLVGFEVKSTYRGSDTRKCCVPRIPGKLIILRDVIVMIYSMVYSLQSRRSRDIEPMLV